MGYSREDLLTFRQSALVTGKYVSCLRRSGVCRPSIKEIRGTRAGQSVRSKIYSIKVVNNGALHSQNSSMSQQGISHSNLVTVKCNAFKDHGRKLAFVV